MHYRVGRECGDAMPCRMQPVTEIRFLEVHEVPLVEAVDRKERITAKEKGCACRVVDIRTHRRTNARDDGHKTESGPEEHGQYAMDRHEAEKDIRERREKSPARLGPAIGIQKRRCPRRNIRARLHESMCRLESTIAGFSVAIQKPEIWGSCGSNALIVRTRKTGILSILDNPQAIAEPLAKRGYAIILRRIVDNNDFHRHARAAKDGVYGAERELTRIEAHDNYRDRDASSVHRDQIAP